MKIGGIQKLSLVDYPHHTSIALFTIGCNMRCGYCHNPELVLPERYADAIPTADVMDFLKSRREKVEGVVVSGGEPTVHADLPELIREIKALGYLVKLDTNGTNPAMVAELIKDGLVDFVAMDIKGSLSRYHEIAARPIAIEHILESIQLIKSSGIDHEFRTTLVKSQVSPADIEEIGKLVHGSRRYALQRFRPGRTISPQFSQETTYNNQELAELQKIMLSHVKECVIH